MVAMHVCTYIHNTWATIICRKGNGKPEMNKKRRQKKGERRGKKEKERKTHPF
jgi:hypothetical protein